MPQPPDQSMLEDLFPPVLIKAEDIGGIPLEVMNYKKDFGGRAWTDVSCDSYNSNVDAFSCMDYETLQYYIAGFLDTILEDPDSASSEFIVYFAGRKQFSAFCDHLNVEQIKFLLAVIDWVIADEYFGEDNRQQYKKQKRKILNKRNL